MALVTLKIIIIIIAITTITTITTSTVYASDLYLRGNPQPFFDNVFRALANSSSLAVLASSNGYRSGSQIVPGSGSVPFWK